MKLPWVLLAFLLASVPRIGFCAQIDVFREGRFSCERPIGARISQSSQRGAFGVYYEPRFGLNIDIMSYSWWGGFLHGGIPGAQEYLALTTESRTPGYRIVHPPTPTSFQGYPAWTLTVVDEFERRPPDEGAVRVQEGYLVIQRRWGFVVVQYTNSPAFFEDDLPQFERFKAGIRLLPEPPGGPILTPLVCILVLFSAIIVVRHRYRRRAGR